jgi:8-oxo-dGTP diphosphatase
MSDTHWPKLGVGVVIFRDNTILLGKRINAHGDNTWSLPGGHVEPFESPHDAAIREAHEETGILVSQVWAGPWVNVVFEKERKHYVTFFMCANAPLNAKAACLEPDKCAGWAWFDLDALPSPLFLPIQQLLDSDKLALINCKKV